MRAWLLPTIFVIAVLITACGEDTEAPPTVNTDAGPQDTTTTSSTESQRAPQSQTHVVNAEARVFRPEILYIQPGDTVAWTNMTSHNTVAVAELIPEGASPWRGKLGENLKITLDIEGIYPYVCEPHIGFGMAGVIIVGKPRNLEAVKAKAAEILQGPYRRLLGKLNKVQIPQ